MTNQQNARQARKAALRAARERYMDAMGSYWSQSASQSVMDDYALGYVVEVRV